jgi:outer membrane protein assembly factor BamB
MRTTSPKAAASRFGLGIGLGIALTTVGGAQDKAPAVESDGAKAQRLVRFLELPERRSEAWRGLLQLRTAAAPPLGLALQDPRPEVAVRAAWILGLLGPDAEMATPALQRGKKAADAEVALACEWALTRITFRGTLLVDYSGNSVVLLDGRDEPVREVAGLLGPWFAEPTAGGNLLVSEYTANRVRELDDKGGQVWAFTDVENPYHVQRLPGGHTMISDAGKGRVIEVDRAGKVVWELTDLKRPVAAERLPDGNTLVCEQNGGRVREFDPAGRVVFEVKDLNRPQRAQRLPNGNTLIAVHLAGEVIEVDATGKPVRAAWPVPEAQMALRRPDGHVLVVATKYWAELDADGKELWRKEAKDGYAVALLRQ